MLHRGGGRQPSVARFKTLCLTLVLCAGASTAAQAGSYVVSYSGGTVTASNSSNSGPYYLDNSGAYGGSAGVGWGVNSASAACSGTITATFTWQPSSTDDPPPTDAVIAETAFAVAGYAGSTPATKAEADNSLGFPRNINTYNVSRHLDPPGGNCRGTRYSLKSNPGNTFTVTATPTATLTGAGSSLTPSSNGSVGVSYEATATPLEVVLGGGIGPKNSKSFLIGQQVTGTVLTGGLTASGFNWSVDAGSPFSDYRVVWSSQTPNTTSATFTPLGTQTQPAVTFHFKQASAGGVDANVSTPVNLAVPAGALPAAGLTATLTQQCHVDPPTKTIDVHIGTVQLLPNPANPQYMGLVGAITPEGSNTGIYWRGTVTTPSQYGSGGGWNVTQLINPTRTRCVNGVTQKTANSGVLALDSQFGYAGDFYTDNTVTPQGSQDFPRTEYFVANSSLYTANDSFNDYMMYLPNGAGSCYVPLRRFDWFWAGRAQPGGSTGVWQLSNNNQGWSFGAEYPDHPQWSSNADLGLNTWVNQ